MIQKVQRLVEICEEAKALVDEIEKYALSHQILGKPDALEYLDLGRKSRARMLHVCHRNNINTVNDLLKMTPDEFRLQCKGVGLTTITQMKAAIKKQFNVNWK